MLRRRRPAMTRMQESIFTIAVIIMVAISILMTKIYLESIDIPDKFENTISGDKIDITSIFAGFVESCYTSRKSAGVAAECYVIHMIPTEDIDKSDLMEKISDSSVPTGNVRFDADSSPEFALNGQTTTYKILFRTDGYILLRKVS